ncbi:hypothetical protein [Ferroacidibacillus organovorans]|uniref:hypothetical protein n=1 Tax=Ferroacidibacillus organovorans TaxID=1765683 RepID=UPI00128F0CD2|nr:hypothetical protein [Ferroacidibacillus organovorans]
MKRSSQSLPTVFLAVTKTTAAKETAHTPEGSTQTFMRHAEDSAAKRDASPPEPLRSFLKKKGQTTGAMLSTRPRDSAGKTRATSSSRTVSSLQNLTEGSWKTLPPHMRTIARYLHDQFHQKPVSILTQGGRFQGVFSGFEGTQIKLLGMQEMSLPLSSVMSVAHATPPESLHKAP